MIFYCVGVSNINTIVYCVGVSNTNMVLYWVGVSNINVIVYCVGVSNTNMILYCVGVSNINMIFYCVGDSLFRSISRAVRSGHARHRLPGPGLLRLVAIPFSAALTPRHNRWRSGSVLLALHRRRGRLDAGRVRVPERCNVDATYRRRNISWAPAAAAQVHQRRFLRIAGGQHGFDGRQAHDQQTLAIWIQWFVLSHLL